MPTPAETTPSPARVAVVGGGIAGVTAALALGEAGVATLLLERGSDVVQGPPMCHLHAGGGLYPELSDDDCRTLLRQSLQVAARYPETIDDRPTLLCVPTRLDMDPTDVLARARRMGEHYADLVAEGRERLLGDPEDYAVAVDRARLERAATIPVPEHPVTLDDWVAAPARLLDLDTLRYPVVAVREHGWNILRLAAVSRLRLADLPSVEVRLGARVVGLTSAADGWDVTWRDADGEHCESVAMVVNAAGFRTGDVDALAGFADADHAVEFKSAWVARWGSDAARDWPMPEIAVLGERGTPAGMAQFTPYPGGHVQLHGMVDGITLFDDGTTTSRPGAPQPPVAAERVSWIDDGFDPALTRERGTRAIAHIAPFLPRFGADAVALPLALGGAQQVPGGDVVERVGQLRVEPEARYVVAEPAKACAAVELADGILDVAAQLGLVPAQGSVTAEPLPSGAVDALAAEIASQRGFPEAMAGLQRPLVAG